MQTFGSNVTMITGRTCAYFPLSIPQWNPGFRGDDTRKHFTTSCSFLPLSTPQWKYEVFLSFRGNPTWKCFSANSCASFPPSNSQWKYDAFLSFRCDYTRKRFVAYCTSFPSSTPQWKYDVFLSFRGEDTRKGFTDHLYTALERHGIITFRDDPELERGSSISPELIAAIEESRFAILVLSKNYASSTWCLEELLKILECMEERKRILPIFYDVDPSSVRKQTGSFADAFTIHEEKLWEDTEKVKSWRAALTKVANLAGWESTNWPEAKLVKDIVQAVWRKLRPTLLSHVDDFVGIDSRLKPIMNFLMDAKVDDVSFIGIWGMGGIGKTTIARVAYDRLSEEFEYRIFLANVRSIDEESGLTRLQKQMLSKIGMQKDERFEDVHEGATLIKRFLYGKKVLLILDDVNHLSQLEYLAGKHEWFGPGSRVFITTRNEQLLFRHGVEKRFEVQRLSKDDSLQLFSWKAFKKDYPEPTYVDLSNHVVDYANGHPLALKVLGSFLFGRGLSAWNNALDKLKEVCNAEIFDTLKISYDGLDDNEKKIFLDIACFFNGEDNGRLREILDACGFYAHIGIDVLVEKSLLTIDSLGKLSMHDLLQEMGREIVRRESPDDPGKRSRLWHGEDISHVLSTNTGTETIEGIMHSRNELTSELTRSLKAHLVKGSHHDEKIVKTVHVNAESFSMMKKLRYLKIYFVNLSDGRLDYLPNSLRILEWPMFPLKSLPSSFNPEDLVELDMHGSRLEHLWTGMKVGTSVLMLQRLALINLKGCENLVSLLSSARSLISLKVLNVSRCSKLDKLPQDLEYAQCLEELDLSETNIRQPPSSIGRLRNLKKLSFRQCEGPLSDPVWNRRLFPFRLPSLSGLHSLIELNLSACNLLEEDIPNDLCSLSSLQVLHLGRNEFVSLPWSICQLSQLVSLDVTNCYKLQTLPELPSSIYSVIATNCISLESTSSSRDILVQLFAYRFMHKEKQGSCNVNAEHFTERFWKFLFPFLPHTRKVECEFIVPGNEIPEWFNLRSVRRAKGVVSIDGLESVLVSIELHPGWFTDTWMGFAFCFSIGQPTSNIASYRMSINGRQSETCYLTVVEFVSNHLWLFYLARHEFLAFVEDEEWMIKSTEIVFSVSCKEVNCAVRVVYKEDVEAADQL